MSLHQFFSQILLITSKMKSKLQSLTNKTFLIQNNPNYKNQKLKKLIKDKNPKRD